MMENNRIVALIDMDCFYCQVEEKINPKLKGKPIAVVQYNEWKGGGIIAVNYLARAKGVTRSMRGDEAKELCPDIELPKVPCVRGKADISKYREAGKDVAHVLQKFTPLLERASIDEAYLDVTQVVRDRMNSKGTQKISSENLPNTYVLGYSNIDDFISDVYKEGSCGDDLYFDQRHALQLLIGAVIISEVRAAVYEATGYRCSAGIAHNKIMSKLVCGMNKPNKQTLLPLNAVASLYETLPLNKIKSLGGKFGVAICEKLHISKMKDLKQFSEKDLQKLFDEKNGSWLYNIARGIDNEPVTPRFSPKSIGCCKKFVGKNAILNLSVLTHWLGELGDEIEERLKTDFLENNRYPTQMVVSFTKQSTDGKDISCSRSINMKKGNGDICGRILAEQSLTLITKDLKIILSMEKQDSELSVLSNPIKYLGISVGKFEDFNYSKKDKNISHFFEQIVPQNQSSEINENLEKNVSIDEEGNNQITLQSTNQILSNENNAQQHNTSILTKLSTQESFFIKYFKSTESVNDPSTSESKEETKNNAVIECLENHANVSKELSISIPHNQSKSILDDQCNSDDSECTIDMEINRSKMIGNCEEPTSPILERPSVPRNFYSYPNSNDKCEDVFEENSYIMCHECNKNIPKSEYSVHSDYHVALSLRQEEKRPIQKPIVQSASAHQENKKKKTFQKEVNHGNITSFFSKPAGKPEPADDDAPVEQCFECGKYIKLSDFSEHLDYHEAKKLSIEINKPQFLSQVFENTTAKRKIDTKAEPTKKSKKDPITASISSFFKEK